MCSSDLLKDFFLGRELAGRIMGHPDGRRGAIYYHLLLIFVAWLPWLPVLLLTALTKWRQLGTGADWRRWSPRIGIEGWLVLVGLLLFSVISSKLPTYTLPLAPWAALLLARVLLKLRGVLSSGGFRSLAVITPGVAVVLYLAAALSAPRFESQFRLNSSLRSVCQALRQHGALVVLTDRYWPGMEFYFGHKAHYVVAQAPRQRQDDHGFCSVIANTHFAPPRVWEQRLARIPGPGVWLVHYTRNRDSAFLKWMAEHPRAPLLRVGDFLLVRAK